MTAERKNDADTAAAPATVRVWDPAIRLFHWSLVLLVAVSIDTGLTGGLTEMTVHMLSGYAILALVLFRFAWGIFGSRHARFADFVRGPAATLAYLRKMIGGRYAAIVGHNPLGAWSILAMLSSLLVQATTGLFANDDIFTEGPLARKVTKATSDSLTAVHDINARVLFVLIGLHFAAVLFYLLVKRQNLITPMLTGRVTLPGRRAADIPFVSPWRAVLAFAGAAAVVAAIVRM